MPELDISGPAELARCIRDLLKRTDRKEGWKERLEAIQALSLAYIALHLSDGLPIVTQPLEI